MKKNQLPDYTAHIITKYYKNNTRPFLDAFSRNCLWIGPAQGQMIRTRKALHAAFAQEDNQLTFAMQNLQVIPIPAGATAMSVVLTYAITTYYPDGTELVFQQRVELLWDEESESDGDGGKRTEYRILLCHISNEFPYDQRDTIYPNHFTDLTIARLYRGGGEPARFALKGLCGSWFYLADNTIVWLESKGRHTLIHATDRVYESIEHINAVTEKYAGSLCKVHASYAVNPLYVKEIGRFYVRLEDGTRLPVPQQRYTAIRDQLHGMIEALREK